MPAAPDEEEEEEDDGEGDAMFFDEVSEEIVISRWKQLNVNCLRTV